MQQIFTRKFTIATVFVVLLLVVSAFFFFSTLKDKSSDTSQRTPLPKGSISEYQNSSFLSGNGVSIFTLNDTGPLYVSEFNGEVAATDFLNQDLGFPNDKGEIVRLLPLGGATGLFLKRLKIITISLI